MAYAAVPRYTSSLSYSSLRRLPFTAILCLNGLFDPAGAVATGIGNAIDGDGGLINPGLNGLIITLVPPVWRRSAYTRNISSGNIASGECIDMGIAPAIGETGISMLFSRW